MTHTQPLATPWSPPNRTQHAGQVQDTNACDTLSIRLETAAAAGCPDGEDLRQPQDKSGQRMRFSSLYPRLAFAVRAADNE